MAHWDIIQSSRKVDRILKKMKALGDSPEKKDELNRLLTQAKALVGPSYRW